MKQRTDSNILDGRRYAILGAGLSGKGAARLLFALGKRVLIIDDTDKGADEEIRELVLRGADTRWGNPSDTNARAWLKGVDVLIPSPGVPDAHPIRVEARRGGIPIAAEIELAWLLSGASKCVAITGTNGKSTVTMLMQHLCRTAGLRGVATGNIGLEAGPEGRSFSDAVLAAGDQLDETIFCAEVSSFQLDDIVDFKPDVGILLNVTPDHLDRHGTFENYARAKSRITLNQGPEDALIVNQDDAHCIKIGRASRARKLMFSLDLPVDEGAWLDAELLMLAAPGKKPERLLDFDRLKLPGMHNVANALAAAAAAVALGIPRKKIAEGLETFQGAAHRLELIATIGGVDYVNDSKATNIDAMVKAIESFGAPIHLIAGGRDKDSPFGSIAQSLAGRVARAYLIGEAAGKIEKAWAGSVETLQCGSLAGALCAASERAAEGEIVLLAPGCASFDQFKDYKDRGRAFRAWVEERAAQAAKPEEART